MEYILVFEDTNRAMKAERLLLSNKLHVGALPLPDEISSGCGICLRVGAESIDVALRVLSESDMTGTTVYVRREVEGQIEYQKSGGC